MRLQDIRTSVEGLTDCSPSGSAVQGVFQARTLEQVAISFSRDLPNPATEPMSLVCLIHGQADELMSLQSLPLNHDLRQRTSELQDLSLRHFAGATPDPRCCGDAHRRKEQRKPHPALETPKGSTPPHPTLEQPCGFLTFRKASEQRDLRGENFPAALAPDEEC